MKTYRVTLTVPVELMIEVNAADMRLAQIYARERAAAYLRNPALQCLPKSTQGVRVVFTETEPLPVDVEEKTP